MIIISHRGNLNGPSEEENSTAAIDTAIHKGFYVEIDVWAIDSKLYLGHDVPKDEISFRWLRDRCTKLWVHCKNLEAAVYINTNCVNATFFWHQTDDFVLTSNNYFWTYPGKKLCNNSIAVMPEIAIDKYPVGIYGVCTDYPEKYKEYYEL